MLHLAHLVQRRHPRHGRRIVATLALLSACAALTGSALLSFH